MTDKDMEVNELNLGLSHVDFEVGDRFYRNNLGVGTKLGTILSSTESELSVIWDDGSEAKFGPSLGESMADRLADCGKPLDLTQLQVGSIISQVFVGARIFAEVTVYVPGKLVEAIFTAPPHQPLIMRATAKESLEKKMAYWELEG